MLRFVTLALALVLSTAEPQSNIVYKNDITPEEAQQYLKNLPFTTPQLAGRTAILPLVRYDDPRFRSAEAGPTLGHYWKNGKEIQNTEDYLEEVYNAAQFHGQDGLGRYAYGYETPESAKVEEREGSGVITGSYVYKSPAVGTDDNLIKVRYWADSQGFHQEDNLPKVELKPAEETPALRDARLAFEKAWKEAAEANKKQPVAPAYPYAYNNDYNTPQIQADPYQTQASESQAVYAPAPVQASQDSQARETRASSSYSESQTGNYQGQGNTYQGSYGSQGQQQPQGKYEEPEPTGPPHGFFYQFTYPVSIIVPKNEVQGGVNQGYPVDHDTYGVGKQ